jgi:hypothetical protein
MPGNATGSWQRDLVAALPMPFGFQIDRQFWDFLFRKTVTSQGRRHCNREKSGELKITHSTFFSIHLGSFEFISVHFVVFDTDSGEFLRGELNGKISLAEAITIASQKQRPIQLGTKNQKGFGCSAIFPFVSQAVVKLGSKTSDYRTQA